MAPDEAGEKPYALLFEALRKTGYMGIAKVAMHNREHIVMLRPSDKGILLHTMFYEDEIRKIDEFRTDTSLVKEKELELATMLIQTLAASFEPEKYKDTYRENLQKMIDAKLQGQEIVETPQPRAEKVIDIMEALKSSLAIARKPVATAQSTTDQAELAAEPEAKEKARPRRRASG
jgi:DNA end-binding protein Ku